MGDQREQSDRRQLDRRGGDRRGGDRRSGASVRHPVFEICRSMLHLALVIDKGEEQPPTVVTRSIRWRKESTALHTELGTAELTDAFHTLVTEEKLAGSVARIALNGELCVTRVISGTADYVRRQLNEQEERSQLYLLLGPGRKAQATCLRQLDARHQQALLTVANQRTLDVLVQVAASVGIQVGSIEPSLVALARAHGHLLERSDAPCLLIQIDERATELGVCHQGNLLLEYRPAGRAVGTQLPEILRSHMSRLQRYIDRYHLQSGDALRDVYLAGAPGPVALSRRKFAELKDVTVHVLQPKQLQVDWEHSGEVPGTEFTAVLGSALEVSRDDSAGRGPNLMEHVLALARVPMRPILLRSAIPLAAILVLGVAMIVANLFQYRVLAKMQSELDTLAPVLSRATLLRLQLGATEAKLKQLKRVDERLLEPNWGVIVSRIGQSMPTEVWLDRMGIEDGQTGQLTGASYTDSGVYDFVGYLEQVPDLERVALEGTGMGRSTAGPTTSFQVVFSLRGGDGREERMDRND